MIKVCGITNIEDALAAIELGADALGFNFYSKSRRYIDPAAAARIAQAVPPGILKVGVFVNLPPRQIERIAAVAGLDVAQLHGDESASDAPGGIRVWKAFRVEPDFDLSRFDEFPTAEAFLLDGPAGVEYGGAGHTFPWTIARTAPKRVILAGGLDAANVADAIRQALPWGIDACSRLESSPGRKDHARMREFLAAARAALTGAETRE